MRSLNILIYGNRAARLRQLAYRLSDEGVKVQISSQLVDCLHASLYGIDFLLIDLDGLNSFLLNLLSAFCRNRPPNFPIIGISTQSPDDVVLLRDEYELKLDDYLFENPRPEDLIVRFPEIATKYMCDIDAVDDFRPSPIAG